MKYFILGALPFVLLAGCSHNPAETTELETNQQKASYAVGMFLGQQVGGHLTENHLDTSLFLQALRDELEGNEMLLDHEAARAASQAYQTEITQRQEEEKELEITRNAAAGQAFLEQNKQRPDIEVLPSGLQYERLTSSANGATPGARDAVRVHFFGTLHDGTVIESSLAQGDGMLVRMGMALPGWQEALTRMKEGEKWRVFLPPELAFGEHGRGDEVLPQSTMIYELELIEVIDNS
ncbi:FKBP-type peptidyl-prolyl cis-trans isomerase [Alcanivorax sp. JB21]|uniref:FKBP-type peptidyl-prolyl cis-trans isomerase N-terminal domain-containing protein n=1 Tax=Alcanivorax limicola TaxID=2874102 RepID=UPI001CBB6B62|nr:FKBP-type peptidyl-prolyl cis-trans isomerase N-terminal domain-containing protein [Alcanivorax limicola]MBZ2188522.1 FKBP-type peptidyl-prolyl cis-trans isomerase [Alcanivorax limicola]